jgi:hypothetical protein
LTTNIADSADSAVVYSSDAFMNDNWQKLWLATALAAGCLCSSARAIVTSDVAGSHIVAPGETAFGLNLDGVARLHIDVPEIPGLSLTFATAALISDRHLLTAAHVFDLDQDGNVDPLPPDFPPTLVSFDLVGGPYQATINHDRIRVMPAWIDAWHDLAIIELDQPAPLGIPRYPLYGLRNEVGKPAVFAGYGLTGHGGSGAVEDLQTFMRAGLNRIEATNEGIDLSLVPTPPNLGPMLVTDFDNGLAANNALLAHLSIASDLGFGPDEVIPTQGDSGGPVFIDGVIAGISSFGSGGFPTDVTPAPDSSWGEIGFHTRVSSFQEFITTASGGEAVFVPEPSTWVLIVAAIVVISLREIKLACATVRNLYRPVRNLQLWNSLEISQVAREQGRTSRQCDCRNSEVHGAYSNPRSTQSLIPSGRTFIEVQDRDLPVVLQVAPQSSIRLNQLVD